MEPISRRALVEKLLAAAIAAVDPEPLARRALEDEQGAVTLIAIGKAAPAMCRGAGMALGVVEGICVTDHEEPVPPGVALMLGDHPVPGARSFRAGRMVLEVAAGSSNRLVALISGGGSSLCEHPIDGVPAQFIVDTTRTLLDHGASIDDINLVRRHLSAIKGGGLAGVCDRPISTYAISDVCGADPAVIASGPTVAQSRDPASALAVMSAHGIAVSAPVRRAIEVQPELSANDARFTLLANGHTAADAVVSAARQEGIAAEVRPGWLRGEVNAALDEFFSSASPGRILVATGEPEVSVTGSGTGGRNTHTALLAARRIEGTSSLFAAFATDGIDGSSTAAGAVVDGDTVTRGGDPGPALAASDSATYLEATGDLVVTGPTGTNVSDLWVLWS